MDIYVGTSGYAYKEWKGRFYPEKIQSGEMLRFYSARLDTVEINNTFYHMPTEAVLTSWAKQVPDHFIFAIKAPQVITHFKQLRNVDGETDYLFRSLRVLGGKLGPVLFQFPKSFRADRPALEAFLDLIPDNFSCAFDFRSQSWIDAGMPDILLKKRCCLCMEDTDEVPVNEIINTAPWGYLRLRRSDYSDDDLSQWIEKIRGQGWKKAFVFFKHEEEARGAETAMRFHELTG
jgi:uncharacterized protein YecE (DUF72 family)